MKKLITILSAVALGVTANAAAVDWNYTGTSAENGYSVYVFTEAVEGQYDTLADLIGSSVQNASVLETGGRTKVYATGKQSYVSAETIGDQLYFAIVSDASATEYKYGSLSTVGLVYDPGAQQTSPGAMKVSNASFTSSGTIGGTPGPGPGPDVPEPTSGLLLLVGMAGLALRRKQK